MSICPDCVAASRNPNSGRYRAGCEACNVRGIALSPKFVREHFYAMHLKASGEDGLKAVKAKVAAEHARIQRLKAQQGAA